MKRICNFFSGLSWPIWILLAFVLLQLAVYLIRFNGSLSSDSADWSAFSTYFGLSFSVLSVLLVYLTYRSQRRMSAVLQFESIFFQWHQQHRAIYKSQKSKIKKFSNEVVMKFLKEHDNFSIEGFLQDSNDSNQREVMPYYRSLYHLMKYVHLSPILDSEDKRKGYIDIIQAQMTDEELNTVLYLLLADEWKNSTNVLGCSLIEMMDKYNLFKNFYYDESEKNFEKFVDFMVIQFPKTTDLFHFLVSKETDTA